MSAVSFSDLSGNYVYDYLKSTCLPGNEILGGCITEHRVVTPTEPRMTISVLVKTKYNGEKVLTYNYRKLEQKAELWKYKVLGDMIAANRE